MDYIEFLKHCVETAKEIRDERYCWTRSDWRFDDHEPTGAFPPVADATLYIENLITRLPDHCEPQHTKSKMPIEPAIADTPVIQMVATGKGDRQTIPLTVEGEKAPIDWADEPAAVVVQNDERKVIEDAVYRGTLRANFVTKNLTEKEQNKLYHETLGIGPAEIVDRKGVKTADRKSEIEKVKKQLQRSK